MIHNFFLAGESGMGLASTGDIIIDALAHMGYRARTDREFPSLIKGGQSKVSIRFAHEPIHGASITYDFGIGLGKTGLSYALEHIHNDSVLVHNFERWQDAFPSLEQDMQARNITLIYVPTRELIQEMHLHTIFENTFVIGALAHLLHIPYDTIEHALYARYGKKEKLRQANQGCLRKGYDCIDVPILHTTPKTKNKKRILLDGNIAIALGAIHAGMRCYYAYPMSPSTSILGYITATAHQTGVVVKQAEDEITAIQMNIGSMYAGARAMTATSGGGFDLMTETISLSGMTEVPLVCVIAQRPGPATGLPTWSAQGDLNLAIYAGHGEFARIVLAVSDPESAFTLTQHAFNLAEQFQVPVIILTEKVVAESSRMTDLFKQDTIAITRHLVTDPEELHKLERRDRYALTESGISKRWLPGTSETIFFCNGDEHHEDGTLDESVNTEHMIMKRIKKQTTILEHLPDPIIYGNTDAAISFIGRGSTKSAVLDCIQQGTDISYLHFDYLYPLKTQAVQDFIAQSKHVCIIENNATGQLQQLMAKEGIHLENKLLKWNGRPFFVEDIIEYVNTYS